MWLEQRLDLENYRNQCVQKGVVVLELFGLKGLHHIIGNIFKEDLK